MRVEVTLTNEQSEFHEDSRYQLHASGALVIHRKDAPTLVYGPTAWSRVQDDDALGTPPGV
ncbi:MAG: hypothetical protein ACRYF3_12000 [Janthinobacterium lividum]